MKLAVDIVSENVYIFDILTTQYTVLFFIPFYINRLFQPVLNHTSRVQE